jgi:hypothetical protein
MNPLLRFLTPITCLVGLALLLLSTGCVSTENTSYRDQPRRKVEFENDVAGKLFYEALSKMQSRRGKSERTTHVSLPIIFDHKERVVEGEGVVFNEAVNRCDTNGDSRITELEARIFADQFP